MSSHPVRGLPITNGTTKKKDWIRPDLDRAVLKELTQRSTPNGLLRTAIFLGFLGVIAVATLDLAQFGLGWAVAGLYLYYFFYGFWVAGAHELQHKTVFGKEADWFSAIFFFLAQVLMWNSPRYARVSHMLHHRYTMIRGQDPETDWPEVITTTWLRGHFFSMISKILVFGALYYLVLDVWKQIKRAAGTKDCLMSEHCTAQDLQVIRWESLGILAFHLAVVLTAIWTGWWACLLFVTMAWQIGSGIEGLWHQTEHIGRPYDVKDHRLNTRSMKVSKFLNLIYWGLDDHVDHHLFPAVPSRNLPRLHQILKRDLAFPKNILDCWAEMYAVSREKDVNPANEYIPEELKAHFTFPAKTKAEKPGPG